jgi:hypothetical protein
MKVGATGAVRHEEGADEVGWHRGIARKENSGDAKASSVGSAMAASVRGLVKERDSGPREGEREWR